MGAGDWILATSQVKAMYAREPIPVTIIGPNGQTQWSDVFENNPKIRRSRGGPVLLNGPGHRPYIAAKSYTHWQWRAWDIAPGEIFMSDAERAFAEPYQGRVLVEPNTKVVDGNKSWPFDRWQRFIDAFGRTEFLQVGKEPSRRLAGVEFVPTTFRQAMAILSVCRVFVGTEGALHHAAAALSVPAVVLWSHFIAPQFTGYPTQINLRHADGWCGSRQPCAECAESMRKITVNHVIAALRRAEGE